MPFGAWDATGISYEHQVEARSASLTKELGLRDLVLTQVVFVVGTVWVGFAAKLGQSQMAFWLIAKGKMVVRCAL